MLPARNAALVRDRRGAVSVLMAVGATAMITLAAFALETANWYSQAAELQRVADSAAMAGATLVPWPYDFPRKAAMAEPEVRELHPQPTDDSAFQP